jgi:hypothetical protein
MKTSLSYKDRVIGLTVKPKITPPILKKEYILFLSVFIRHGSNTMPTEEKIKRIFSETVISIENNARNNIKYTLDGVFDFMNFRHKDMAPQYKV